MEVEEIRQIAFDYLESLPNRDVAQDTFKVDKLAVGFAGIPGSGKTHIARLIEDKRKALRISDKEIRDEIRAENPDLEVEEVRESSLKVLENIVELLEERPNNLVVLDMGFDREHEQIDQLLESHGYQTIIISIEIDREEAEERIRNREPDFEEKYEPHFERWIDEHEAFLENYHEDLSINGMSPDTEAVLQLVDRHLHNQKGNEPEPMDDMDSSHTKPKPTQPQP